MTTVVALNIFYGVGVEESAAHYLLFAIILALQDRRRLSALYVFNGRVPGALPAQRAISGRSRLVLKTLLILFVLYERPSNSVYGRLERLAGMAQPTAGIFVVERFVLNGDTTPPVVGDRRTWQQIELRPAFPLRSFPNRITI